MFKDNIKPDYGWGAPVKTSAECKNPEFVDRNLHRVAIVKEEHFGSAGDRDPNGLSGWSAVKICNGCGRKFKAGFYSDKKDKEQS